MVNEYYWKAEPVGYESADEYTHHVTCSDGSLMMKFDAIEDDYMALVLPERAAIKMANLMNASATAYRHVDEMRLN